MAPADDLFSRQAQWQRSRRNLSWPEKIREVERLRPSLEAFREMRIERRVTPFAGVPPSPARLARRLTRRFREVQARDSVTAGPAAHAVHPRGLPRPALLGLAVTSESGRSSQLPRRRTAVCLRRSSW